MKLPLKHIAGVVFISSLFVSSCGGDKTQHITIGTGV